MWYIQHQKYVQDKMWFRGKGDWSVSGGIREGFIEEVIDGQGFNW